MKTLLITGAYGLVGSNICQTLERDYPNIKITKSKSQYFGLWKDPKFDYIIHAAGYGQPQMFSKDKLETIRSNTISLSSLFSFLRPDGKLLFVSSSEVYSGAKSPYKETDIGTTTPQHPRSCYIEGKRCGEAICMAYEEQGVDVKIARLSLAYGPGTKKGDTRVLNQFIEQALTKKEIRLLDGGEALRTYCYIDDAVTQLLNILFHGNDVVYNVGGFSKISILGLAQIIGSMTDADVIEGYGKNSVAPEDVALDMTKYINEFGGKFTILEDGLLKTIEYQKQLYA